MGHGEKWAGTLKVFGHPVHTGYLPKMHSE